MSSGGAAPDARVQADGENVDDELVRRVRLRNLERLVVRRLPERCHDSRVHHGHTGRAVPGAVVITGWDDSDAAAPAGLIILRQSLRDQGRRCAYIALAHREPSAEQDPPSWQVIQRTSTRPLG